MHPAIAGMLYPFAIGTDGFGNHTANAVLSGNAQRITVVPWRRRRQNQGVSKFNAREIHFQICHCNHPFKNFKKSLTLDASGCVPVAKGNGESQQKIY